MLVRLEARSEANEKFSVLDQRIAMLSREIVRRRAAESQLEAVSQRLRVTLSSIGDAVIATDQGGRVTFLNPVAEKLTGWPLSEATGILLHDVVCIIDEASRQRLGDPLTEVLATGGIAGVATHALLIGRDGAERPVDRSGAPIHDDRGRFVGVVLTLRDVAERHAMETELRIRSSRLEEAHRRKDEFLAMLAHELRNPLAPLSNAIALLRRPGLPAERVGQLVSMMDRQTLHLVRLVDDLLDAARLTNGKIGLKKERVSLTAVLAQALDTVRSEALRKEQSLKAEWTPADVQVEADEIRLVQVFANLLSNAVKFTPPGGIVKVTVLVLPGKARVDVIDTGLGLSSELSPRVFDLFVQAHTSIDRSQGGLGIGLTVVRELVELHGGSVEVASAGLGHGATFSVTLPLAGESRETASNEASFVDRLERTPVRLSILVVDDNVDAAESLSLLLGTLGHAVRAVHDPREALDMFQQGPRDVVVLDLGLPGMDGYELARRIRALPGPRRPLLLAVTGYGDDCARERSRAAGFDAHLTKPVHFQELAGWLEKWAARDEG